MGDECQYRHVCESCGREFLSSVERDRFCSYECRDAYYREWEEPSDTDEKPKD